MSCITTRPTPTILAGAFALGALLPAGLLAQEPDRPQQDDRPRGGVVIRRATEQGEAERAEDIAKRVDAALRGAVDSAELRARIREAVQEALREGGLHTEHDIDAEADAEARADSDHDTQTRSVRKIVRMHGGKPEVRVFVNGEAVDPEELEMEVDVDVDAAEVHEHLLRRLKDGEFERIKELKLEGLGDRDSGVRTMVLRRLGNEDADHAEHHVRRMLREVEEQTDDGGSRAGSGEPRVRVERIRERAGDRASTRQRVRALHQEVEALRRELKELRESLREQRQRRAH